MSTLLDLKNITTTVNAGTKEEKRFLKISISNLQTVTLLPC